MRKNWLGGVEMNAVRRGSRSVFSLAGRWFRSRPVVSNAAFQGEAEPYPGHWRDGPEPWLDPPPSDAEVRAALDGLPDNWRELLLRHDGVTVEQERRVLALARAALRDRLVRGRRVGAL